MKITDIKNHHQNDPATWQFLANGSKDRCVIYFCPPQTTVLSFEVPFELKFLFTLPIVMCCGLFLMTHVLIVSRFGKKCLLNGLNVNVSTLLLNGCVTDGDWWVCYWWWMMGLLLMVSDGCVTDADWWVYWWLWVMGALLKVTDGCVTNSDWWVCCWWWLTGVLLMETDGCVAYGDWWVCYGWWLMGVLCLALHC